MTTITNNDHKKVRLGLRRLLVKEFRKYRVSNFLRSKKKISAY